jgi:uncharacterized protein with HEPN domain
MIEGGAITFDMLEEMDFDPNGLMSFEEFLKDSKTIDAVIRNFEIIGEAANRLPDEFKEEYPSIDWHKIRGFRNRIVHDYMGIDFSIVWDIRNSYLPSLIESLKKI